MAKDDSELMIFLSFLIFLLSARPSCSQNSKIVQGEQLRYGQNLVSDNGMFILGFWNTSIYSGFRVNDSYLAIWYNGEQRSDLVWIANRNTPITKYSGILTIDHRGNLKILQDKGDPIILYAVQEAANTTAAIEDTGNFVLRKVNPDDESVKQVLWQSFDYPTDTFLPGMKIGINLRTGHSWSLTSWQASGIFPAPGSFSLGMDPNSKNQLVMRWRGDIIWTSGPWHSRRFPDLPDDSDLNSVYNFACISNEDEVYFNYSVNKSISIFPQIILSDWGTLRGPNNQFSVACLHRYYSFSSSMASQSGCVEPKLPDCRDPKDIRDFSYNWGFMSVDGLKFGKSENLTETDCWAKCLSDCFCVAYAATEGDYIGCEIWNSTAGFTESNSDGGRDIYLRKRATVKWWLWLTIVVSGAFILPPLCAIFCLIRMKLGSKEIQIINHKKLLNELGGNPMPASTNGKVDRHEEEGNELDAFSFQAIAMATNYFSGTNKLGEGGFGPVYKGKLFDGREIAVKRLSASSGQGLVEFKNEAILIAKLQHTNLVRLLGFCIQGVEKMLVYEYMPNKSLDFFLFGSQRKSIVDWKKRFNIIEGIAQGLLYLHKYSRLRVIHRDLKASNVLLDDEMNPKISDFGMARIFGLKESEANTSRVVGTYGYMSPEYAMSGIVSTKTDVFSFGVLLLEIVSGKKNNSFCHPEHPLNLIGYAWQLWIEGHGLQLVDPILEEFCPENVIRCMNVGLLCVQYHAADRPTMSDVTSMLSNAAMELPAPKQPAFFMNSDVEEPEIQEDKPENCSINQVSISAMEAR